MQKSVFLAVDGHDRKKAGFISSLENSMAEKIGKKHPEIVIHRLGGLVKTAQSAAVREQVSSKKPDYVFIVVFSNMARRARDENGAVHITHHHGDKTAAMQMARKLAIDLWIRGRSDLYPISNEAHTLSTLKIEILHLFRLFESGIEQGTVASILDEMFHRYKEHFQGNSQKLDELVVAGLGRLQTRNPESIESARHLAHCFELYSALFAHNGDGKIVPGHHVLLPLLPEYERNELQVVNGLVKALRFGAETC